MPKTPVNYSDTMFYKIVCRDITITELYVGSTTNFRQRKAQHKSDCCNEKSKKYDLRVYTFIRDNGGWENWDMIMIHRQSCVDALEAHTIERGYVESLGATLNCILPSRTNQESQEHKEAYNVAYYEANKDTIRESSAAYREANKDAIRESNAARYEANKDAIRESGAAYREANKDAIRESGAAYREANKDARKIYDKQHYAKKKLLNSSTNL